MKSLGQHLIEGLKELRDALREGTVEKRFRVVRYKPCPFCEGDLRVCIVCAGTGKIRTKDHEPITPTRSRR